MVNNFYIGDVHHTKTIKKDAYTEKLVLYSEDKYNYLDLINDINYTTDNNKKAYVLEESQAKFSLFLLLSTMTNSFSISYFELLKTVILNIFIITPFL